MLVVGAGKGAAALAAAVEAGLGDAVVGGLVIVPHGYARARLRRVALARGGHPVPDRRSIAATARLIACLERHPAVPAIVLVTGGASSLLVKPAPGLGLADKRRTTELLLASGAGIRAVNTVRKHLSAIKGGRLAEILRGRRAVALVVSDVPGDDLGTIGSGPTVADPTTYADALEILARYALATRVPPAVRRHLERGRLGLVAETPKRVSAAALRTVLLATNATARRGALVAARRRGLRTTIDARRPITGDVGEAARSFARRLLRLQRQIARGSSALLVAGGETTVTLGARAGRGGRNQEFALGVASVLAGRPGWALLAAGSDGIDGPTPAAGAFADGATIARAEHAGRSVAAALRRHDVFPLLAELGDLFCPGPTGTNVADLVLALVWSGRPPPRS